jgi:voltage-gated potassium channel
MVSIIRSLAALAAVVIIGTIGYSIIEGWTFIDSLYMTIITISTVGYAEIKPLSTAGQIFTIILILGGVGTVFYILTSLVRYVLEGELGFRMGRRRMETKIKKLHDHFIICGFGKVGKAIADTLNAQGTSFIVIDHSPECVEKAQEAGYLVIQEDAATDDNVLRTAGIGRARALITALGEDADNTYITLAARQLNPELPIIARANNVEARKKLKLAGANRIVSPDAIGGHRMAMLALRPEAVEFVETVILGTKQELLIEEIEIGEKSTLIGSSVKQIQEQFPGVVILALRKDDATLITSPKPNTIVRKTSSLVAFGTSEQLMSIEGCCQKRQTAAKPTKTASIFSM